MRNLAESLGFSFSVISAVDSSAADFEPAFASWKIKLGPTGALGKGSVACALSHIRAWKAFLDDSLKDQGLYREYAVILEDDVVLSDDFVKVIAELQSRSMLGYGLVKLELGGPMEKGAFLGRKVALDRHRGLRRSFQVLPDAAAYMLSLDTAKHFLSFTDRISVPIDHFLFYPVKADGFHGTPYSVLDPAIAVQDRSLQSDISLGRYTDTRRDRDKLRLFYEARQAPAVLKGLVFGRIRFCKVSFQ